MISEPGERYNYGTNIDWLGLVIEAISGQGLDEYIKKSILSPLGMNDSGSERTGRQFDIHLRGEDEKLVAHAELVPAVGAELYGGGHYLYSTLDNYSTLLLTILNDGQHPQSGVRILRDETVKNYLFKDMIHDICSADGIGQATGTIPQISARGEMLPGLKKGWSCGLMLNLEGIPKGRSADSGAWAGLGNLFYWMDPKAGKLGFFITEILPFMDPETLHLFDEFERAVYDHESSNEIGKDGCNYSISSVL